MFQFLATIAAVILIATDQIIKNWVEMNLAGGDDMEIIKDVLYLRYTENTGVAFSMFQGMRWLLIAVTGVMLLAVLGAFLSGKVSNRWHIASLSLILAGGVGNLIDRISLGYVIDYIDFRVIRFAIFNLADSCITVGAVLLCFSILLQDYLKGREKRAAAAEISIGEPDLTPPEDMEDREAPAAEAGKSSPGEIRPASERETDG
ncbi:MAG TPA: signal peptidase II [Oscillospiraceae bacterium]|nr:signal peptidase II [Oscillospiraceae bacterium]HNW05193.1 signal peptidase II [Oscillospiraceae bacterium]HPV99844.1 signal peptidase II [Oscillospiraceae bacterium]